MDTEVGLNDYYGSLQYDAMLQMVDNAVADGLSKDKLLKNIPALVREHLKDKRAIPVILVAPGDHLQMDSLTFESVAMQEAMKLGVSAARKALTGL